VPPVDGDTAEPYAEAKYGRDEYPVLTVFPVDGPWFGRVKTFAMFMSYNIISRFYDEKRCAHRGDRERIGSSARSGSRQVANQISERGVFIGPRSAWTY
jgi:hypothetical protein